MTTRRTGLAAVATLALLVFAVAGEVATDASGSLVGVFADFDGSGSTQVGTIDATTGEVTILASYPQSVWALSEEVKAGIDVVNRRVYIGAVGPGKQAYVVAFSADTGVVDAKFAVPFLPAVTQVVPNNTVIIAGVADSHSGILEIATLDAVAGGIKALGEIPANYSKGFSGLYDYTDGQLLLQCSIGLEAADHYQLGFDLATGALSVDTYTNPSAGGETVVAVSAFPNATASTAYGVGVYQNRPDFTNVYALVSDDAVITNLQDMTGDNVLAPYNFPLQAVCTVAPINDTTARFYHVAFNATNAVFLLSATLSTDGGNGSGADSPVSDFNAAFLYPTDYSVFALAYFPAAA